MIVFTINSMLCFTKNQSNGCVFYCYKKKLTFLFAYLGLYYLSLHPDFDKGVINSCFEGVGFTNV
jgi:hypothetical protein